MSDTKHSPLPWDNSPGGRGQEHTIIDSQRDSVCRVLPYSEPLAHGNAEFIVRAVNCHDELVKMAEAYMDIFPCNCGSKCEGTCDYSRCAKLVAKAKGTQ